MAAAAVHAFPCTAAIAHWRLGKEAFLLRSTPVDAAHPVKEAPLAVTTFHIDGVFQALLLALVGQLVGVCQRLRPGRKV